MPLSPQLQQAIDQAYEAVEQHPQHALLPFYRGEIYKAISPAIYNALRELIDPPAYRVRVMLSLLTGPQILPVWQQERPDDTWPQDLLDMVERVLRGTVSPEQASIEAEKAFDQAGELAQTMEEPALQRVWAVVAFAIEALFEAAGAHGFGTMIISRNETDANLDPWTSDPALWAAAAYAGPVWDPESDSIRRKEFWEWWLREALPAAWEAGHAYRSINQS